MTKYTFTGETPLFYPRLADYPVEGESQNLEAKQGDVVEFAVSPPPGPWAEVTGDEQSAKDAPKTRKVTE